MLCTEDTNTVKGAKTTIVMTIVYTSCNLNAQYQFQFIVLRSHEAFIVKYRKRMTQTLKIYHF